MTVIAVGRQSNDSFFCSCRSYATAFATNPNSRKKKNLHAPISFSSHAIHSHGVFVWPCIASIFICVLTRYWDCIWKFKYGEKSCPVSKDCCSHTIQSPSVCRHSSHLSPFSSRVVWTCLDLVFLFLFCLFVFKWPPHIASHCVMARYVAGRRNCHLVACFLPSKSPMRVNK